MKSLKAAWFVLALLVSGSAAARHPEAIVNYPAVAVVSASGKALSVDQVKQVIRSSAERKKWLVVNQPDGKLLASLSWNGDKHMISVEITCSAESYSIIYKDSINMHYAILDGQASIHPYYNKFVRELKGAIQVELSRL